MNELILPWKTEPKTEAQRLAFNLINAINYSVQRIIDDQELYKDILTNRGSSMDEIIKEMGDEGQYWLQWYNLTNEYIDNITKVVGKTMTDVVGNEDIKTVATSLAVDAGGKISVTPVEKLPVKEEIIPE
jgi:hypothetical protein